MNTLTEMEYLQRDEIMLGVADWIVKESPLTGVLPQKQIKGNAYKYNVSLTLPTSSWLDVGDQIVESTGTWEQRSTDIYTLIQDGNVPKASIDLANEQNPEAAVTALAAQSMAHEFEKTLIFGQTTTGSTTKQFKGLLRIIAELESSSTTDLDGATAGADGNNSQVLAAGATNGATSQALMDELLDKIKPGKADLLLMSRLSRRRLNTLARASGSSGLMLIDSDLFGKVMMSYDGVPIYVSDFLPDNFPDNSSSVTTISTYDYDAARSSGSNLDNSFIFAMQVGDRKVQALHAGEMKHERSDPNQPLADYHAIKNRYIWYCGLMCASKFSLAVLTGLVS